MSRTPQLEAATYARAAFCTGLAEAGPAVFPLTAQTRAAAAAAVTAAAAHWDRPALIETTLQIGRVEGHWAVLLRRRQHLLDAHVNDTLAELLADVAAALPAGTIADRAAGYAHLGVTEAISKTLIAEIVAVALAVLARLFWSTPTLSDRWTDLSAEAAMQSTAEGQAQAGALLAVAGGDTPDVDSLYDEAYNNLDAAAFATIGGAWVDTQLEAAAAKIGRSLAGPAAAGAPRDELVKLAGEAVTDPNAAPLALDTLVTTTINDETQRAYSDADVEIDFITAGDDAVCEDCEDAEGGSPYPPDQAPAPPIHPRCRCVLAPVGLEVPAAA